LDGIECGKVSVHHFCTYFDHRYLPQGLALCESLRRHAADFRLWVLCLNDACHEALEKLAIAEIRAIKLEEFEKGDEALYAAKENRSIIEYYFTCTSSLPLYIFRTQPDVDIVTYIDADLFFFSDPTHLFNELAENSIGIISHRFSAALRHMEEYGIFNVGWVTFRHDERALTCLRWWRERCLEWCYDRKEPGRFADQKYLDDWPRRFNGVTVLKQKGANVAPWNLSNYSYEEKEGSVLVDGQPLIFFHFHHLKRRTAWLFETAFLLYKVKLNSVLKRCVFGPYLKTVERQRSLVKRLVTQSQGQETIRLDPTGASEDRRVFPRSVQQARQLWRELRAQQKLVYLWGRVL
jgi:hypothetical protein